MHPKIEELKAKAKAEGLWNLLLQVEADPMIKYVSLSDRKFRVHHNLLSKVLSLTQFNTA